MNLSDTLSTYFQSLAAEEKFSGVVRVTRGDAILFAGAYGYASRAWRVPNTLDTRFDTASITKLFTAVAALQCVGRGQFSLDTSVVDYLGLKGTRISPQVNVFHLLTHSSGIADDVEEENGEVYEDMWKTRPCYSVQHTVDFLPQFVHKEPNFPPGQGCRYNNCAFVLLGLMVEKASGMEYRDYVRRHVFAPAGMAHSDFLRLDRVNENMAEGCDPILDENKAITGWKKNIYSFPPVGSPDSGAHVTAADLERFMRAVLRGELLTPKLTKIFFTPQVLYRKREGWDKYYGTGLWFYVRSDGSVLFYEKEGINAGVSGMIRHFPEKDISAVILSNMEEGAWDPIWAVHEQIVAEFYSKE